MSQKIKIHCNVCKRITNSEVLYTVEDKHSQPDEPNYSEIFETIKCCGCECIRFKYFFDAGSEENSSTEQYPKKNLITRPAWLNGFFIFHDPGFIWDLLSQIYKCIDNECFDLAVMGIRSLIEKIMIDKNGADLSSFSKNLDGLLKNNVISIHQKESLLEVIEAGHATTHRSYSPKLDDIEIIMEVTASIIETLYIHPNKAKKLRQKIPPRAKPSKITHQQPKKP